jgi:hypothetical protein
MKLNGDVRIDFIKVDLPAELERGVLLSMLDSGIRPSFVMVKWNKYPNTDTATSIAAGHLQNCGYHLLGKYDNKFIYYYTDNDLYMTCNWDGTDFPNPIVKAIVNKIKYSNTRLEGPNVRNIQPPLPAIGETNTIIESETTESTSSSLQ